MSLTTNTIGSDVDAFIDGAKVITTAGDVALTGHLDARP